ncbi:unnamed protein product [Cuscuta europaea]|uniref:Pectinesterase n=1 Tax=Cuscuta europaea TaxID=41803 RepID=A0A9P1E9X4_CUSEU|nr:unnamed protein product [Cuscuta europaea]
MAPSWTAVMVAVLLCSWCAPGSAGAGEFDFVQSKCLKVPATEFVRSVISAIRNITQANATVAEIGESVGHYGHFRLSTAISDCLDLLDFSAEELSWTIHHWGGKKSNSTVGIGTGNMSADLRTWLTAALSNQDTCLQGFDATNGTVKKFVERPIKQVTAAVRHILAAVESVPPVKNNSVRGRPTPKPAGGRKLLSTPEFPEWLKPNDRKLLQSVEFTPDAVVALDGTGNFTSIMDAVSAVNNSVSDRRYVIHVKKGVYRENVEIGKKKWNIMMIGDGKGNTIISGNRSFIDGWTTFRSATFAVKGLGFIARDLTIENTAGPEKHQAVAFRSDSDLSVLYRCAITGYQDTLYAHTLRQFYRECYISGTVDFIFGNAAAVFQKCQIQARQGLPDQKNTITAHGRKDPTEPTGFSIQFCKITGDPGLIAAGNSTSTYLGRPWKLYSRTVVMESYLSSVIMPRGWLEWNASFALDTLFYGEYLNYGPGAGLGSRVNWTGYHGIMDFDQANDFTVARFIRGNTWLPSTGFQYTAGLKEV